MGIIARDKNQITLIYSSNTQIGQEALGYLAGSGKRYLDVDLAKTKVADTIWVEIASALGVKVGDLVEKELLEIPEETDSFGTHDWIKIIQKNDKAIRPIVIMGDKTEQLESSSEILRFIETDN